MDPLDAVGLRPLMEASSGAPETVIGLLDGPVATEHPDLISGNIKEVPGGPRSGCLQTDSEACRHGTFVEATICCMRHQSALGCLRAQPTERHTQRAEQSSEEGAQIGFLGSTVR